MSPLLCSWRVFRVQGEDSGVKSAEPAVAPTGVDTDNSLHSTAAAGSESWWQDDSWGAAPSERADERKNEPAGNNGSEAGSNPQTSGASAGGPDVSRVTSSNSARDVVEDSSKASDSNGAEEREARQNGREQQTDVRAECSDFRSDAPATDDWGSSGDSWGGGGASEWDTGGAALDMRALSEAIAEAADAANKRTDKPRGDDVSGTRVTSADSTADREDERAGSGAGASVLPCFYIVAGEEAPEKRRKEAQVGLLFRVFFCGLKWQVDVIHGGRRARPSCVGDSVITAETEAGCVENTDGNSSSWLYHHCPLNVPCDSWSIDVM